VYYGIPQKDDVVIQQGTTNGCGGGFTYEQAAVAAVTELIERDALMLLWYSGRNPQIIDMSSGTGPYIDHIRSAQKDYGLEVYFLDTTYDTEVPSCICVIIDPVLNIVAMGGKASLSRDPLRGAYVEALTVLASSRGRIERGVQGNAFFKKNTFTDATMSQRERETQCCTPEGVAWVREHMLSGTSIPYGDFVRPLHTFDSEKEELTALVAKFRQLTRHYGDSYSLYLYEFDSKWTREYSYHVVRAFVPSFLKLHLKEHYATPYSKRLRRYMEHYGIPYEYERINTVPHFFP
jgi:thiazole/oxazole-forming peptide maturase SagD family component